MRILLINDYHTLIGGAEHYFFDLIARLKQLPNMEIYWLSFGEQLQIGDDFLILPALHSKLAKGFWQFIFHPVIFWKIRQYLKQIRPDVIHLHNIKQYSSSLFAAIKNYPLVQTIHDYQAICPTAYNIHKKNHQACKTGFRWSCWREHRMKFNRLTYLMAVLTFLFITKKQKKYIQHFFAPSPLLVNYLQKNKFNARYIPPFIQKKTACSFKPLQPQHFLFAGQLGAHKGVRLLIEEFALALKKNPHLYLTVAGQGVEETYLQARVKTLNIEKNILFVGWQADLTVYYQQCIAIIFPSIWLEAFGLVMAEAMNHGRAIIGSNRGSPTWLIEDNKNGLIFDPCKSGDLAEKILLLADHFSLAISLGQSAYEKIHEMIDNEKTLAQLCGVYEKLKNPSHFVRSL